MGPNLCVNLPLVSFRLRPCVLSVVFICPFYPWMKSFYRWIKPFSMDKIFLLKDKTFLSMDKTFLLIDKTFLSMEKIILSMNKNFFTSDKSFKRSIKRCYPCMKRFYPSINRFNPSIKRFYYNRTVFIQILFWGSVLLLTPCATLCKCLHSFASACDKMGTFQINVRLYKLTVASLIACILPTKRFCLFPVLFYYNNRLNKCFILGYQKN